MASGIWLGSAALKRHRIAGAMFVAESRNETGSCTVVTR